MGDETTAPDVGSSVEVIGSTHGNALSRPNDRSGTYRDPAYAYLISKTTEKSRRTCVERMRVIAKCLGARENDHDAWRSIPWARLTHAETNMIRAQVVKNGAPSSARLTITVLKGVLREAFRLEIISAEQYQRAIDLDRVHGKRTPPGRALTDDEIGALRRYIATQRPLYAAMVQAIFAVGLGAGLRREEIANLSVAGVEPGQLRFVGKGRKEAVQPIVGWAENDLQRWLEARKRFPFACPAVFVRVDPRRPKVRDAALTPWMVWETVRMTQEGAKVKEFTPHDFRRTYASRMLSLGDLSKAQRMMRHANPATTVGYDRRPDEEARSVLSAVEAMGPGERRCRVCGRPRREHVGENLECPGQSLK